MSIRWRPRLRKVDVLFLIGLVGFLSQALRAYQGQQADTVIVSGSIAMMGLPIVRRLDERCNHHDS